LLAVGSFCSCVCAHEAFFFGVDDQPVGFSNFTWIDQEILVFQCWCPWSCCQVTVDAAS
jgi:hypothetical protein